MPRNIRIRWEVQPSMPASNQGAETTTDEAVDFAALHAVNQLLKGGELVSYYQPVFSTLDGSVFGYEALARLTDSAPFSSIHQMFQTAIATGSLAALDIYCMETALAQLDASSFVPTRSYLFLNACPETLMNPDFSFDRINKLLGNIGIPCERIVLEVTEENVISNYDLFRHSLEVLRARGFKIAIDDFGSGYAGLKMLSSIEPDFLKIDRHFIDNIDRANIRFNLVQAVATACHRIGIRVIAEGIERPEELAIVKDLGIELVQGFLLGIPSPKLDASAAMALAVQPDLMGASASPARGFVGDISTQVEPLAPTDPIMTAFRRFMAKQELGALPVVKNNMVVGILNRRRFLEEQIIGSAGYGFSLNSMKRVYDVMEERFIPLEANCTLHEASQKIHSTPAKYLDDNLIVVKNGWYQGVLEVGLLLEALTEENLLLARDSNPLSGLPGNNVIQREITRRLAQSMHFDTLYIDIDHFKPFNDHYGFAKGDQVIVILAEIIRQVLAEHENTFNFAGHIGGDDFIVITRPPIGFSVANAIISQFESRLPGFHGETDFAAFCYASTNRRGETEQFPLLSISIGIVSTEVFKITCYSQLASIACEVKRAAKQQPGSAVARDMRKMQSSQGIDQNLNDAEKSAHWFRATGSGFP
jgi:EAL domain-containing protein (putative c-di-GMP-specific phosphodiesterase class I)/GGDEF domain-containing protein